MSGHSKWATIKRQKGVTDAKRSQVFTKLAKAITVAARGGADPTMNFKLRLAIDRARGLSMPKDNIDRAINKGAGGGDETKLEEVTYEGYGPAGVAFIIETLTNNRNRTSHSIRHILESHGGRLAEIGSVLWMFESKAVIQVNVTPQIHDTLELALIEVGAEDIAEDVETNTLGITSAPTTLEAIKSVVKTQGLTPEYASVELVSKTTIPITDLETENKLNALREALEDDEDITNVYSNQV